GLSVLGRGELATLPRSGEFGSTRSRFEKGVEEEDGMRIAQTAFVSKALAKLIRGISDKATKEILQVLGDRDYNMKTFMTRMAITQSVATLLEVLGVYLAGQLAMTSLTRILGTMQSGQLRLSFPAFLVLSLWASALTLGCAEEKRAAAKPLAIADVTVIDTRDGAARPGMTVAIRG